MSENKKYILSDKSGEIFQKDKPTVIVVDHVSMDYNFANEKLNSFKEYFIAIMKRELVFKKFRALNDISFDVQRGDVFGILGTNGSGKSTLLKIVSGVLDPTEGSVSIEGNIAPLIEMGAGFDYELTGRENVFLNGALLGYSKEFINQHFDEIVEFSEIGKFIDLPLKNYSSGMISRLAFAIATVIVPDILIVDEVLSVGDQMFRRKCEKRIQEIIHVYGTTVLMVSHSSSEIERICNKAIWIEKGHMRMIGDAKRVSQVYQALGGHRGTDEGERYLYSLLSKDCQKPFNSFEYIYGNDDYSISDSINRKLIQSNTVIDTIVFAEDNHPRLLLLAMSLAARFEGMLSICDKGEIGSHTEAFIMSNKLDRIFALCSRDRKEGVVGAINHCDGLNVDYFLSDDYSAMSIEILDFVNSRYEIGDTVVVSIGNVGTAAAVFSNYIYFNKLPVLTFDSESDWRNLIVEQVAKYEFKNVYLFYGYDIDPTSVLHKLEDNSINVIALSDQIANCDAAFAVGWMSEELSDISSILVTSVDRPNSSILAATLAKSNHFLNIPIDHINMDSMQVACETVSSFSTSIQKIDFVGSQSSFDEIDKVLLSKAASKE